ncbi:hypothetical protein NLJ89_g4727 [Agrocybe chaxingu]|uniref:HTH CENPB-type domain-containing protein n=1 Tax=Agrocybe chaxingu TaxID=84603 RepID=A0A9W8MVP2_9AGAR|nr:hypothetical protein NLJ89_g4727 [Agrocybe chaxingu]
MGRRNVPLHPTAIVAHAQAISGVEVGEAWVRRFRARHPDLKARWTSGHKKVRAGALNKAAVREFYDEYETVCKEYNIKDKNKYNIDEKGCLCGIGAKVKVLISSDQKDAKLLEDGDRENITIVECVCADGTMIRPTVIFQGKRHNLEWGRENPCDASISHSPKGWTDQELGSKWLERDFDPQTRDKAGPDEYRLIILDGHNSHTTYRFCSYAERNKIIVICLPPHTTHELQPCDVGVFGPLATAWRAEVTALSLESIPIRKKNFIKHYSKAREKAFTSETIRNAWQKTGLVPFDRNALPEIAYEPSLNTTTKPTQPVPASLPEFITPISSTSGMIANEPTNDHQPSPSRSQSNPLCKTPSSTPHEIQSAASSANSSTPSAASGTSSTSTKSIEDLPDEEFFARMTSGQMYEFMGLPARPHPQASREEIAAENLELRKLLDKACWQMQRDYALKKLMDRENGRLRDQLYAKKAKPTNKYLPESEDKRHLTSEESLQALAIFDLQQSRSGSLRR